MDYQKAELYIKEVIIPIVAKRFEEYYPYIFQTTHTREEEEIRVIPYRWYMTTIRNIDQHFLGMILTDQKPIQDFNFLIEYAEQLKTSENFFELIIKTIYIRN